MAKSLWGVSWVAGLLVVFFLTPVAWAQLPAPVLPNAGPAESVEPTVGEFDSVAISGPFTIEIVPGDRRQVRVDAERRVLAFVETKVIDGTLHVRPVKKHPPYVFAGRRIFVRIVTPRLRVLSVAGSAAVSCERVHESTFSLQHVGSGEVQVRGRVGALTVTQTGSGDIDASELAATSATVSLTGSGRVRVAVSERLTGAVSGSGELVYLGDPALKVEVNGLGKIRREK